ncbi:hypothetical protein CMI47_05640 [Candidatus Pacearchaeota archaeon]|jgi:Zn-dependent peptidase ImmA (M78 family)|nr:hypothetical protein [Candidatus Pacearchaeota archaeon]|tara:strand:+ start:936 stop:1196 length:261 start_codon:yes stop_codon:yes gene_type:complete
MPRTAKRVSYLWNKEAAERAERNGTGFTAKQNARANKLAVQILMPATQIKEHLAAGRTVKELAEMYQVAEAAMEIRVRGLIEGTRT